MEMSSTSNTSNTTSRQTVQQNSSTTNSSTGTNGASPSSNQTNQSSFPQPPILAANFPPGILLPPPPTTGANVNPQAHLNYLNQFAHVFSPTSGSNGLNAPMMIHPQMLQMYATFLQTPQSGKNENNKEDSSGDNSKGESQNDSGEGSSTQGSQETPGAIDPSAYPQFPFYLYPSQVLVPQMNNMVPPPPGPIIPANGNQGTSQSKKRRAPPAGSGGPNSKKTKKASSPPPAPIASRGNAAASSSTRDSNRASKGLRHFSMKVCEQVQMKGTTTYNQVATELVHEIVDSNPGGGKSHDEKNIRRRVYDALNVLMALNIISKDKKEIRWKGLPVNYHQEYDNLQTMKQQHADSITLKTQQLNELLRQQRALSNLYQRNTQPEYTDGNPRVELPFIIVQTANETHIECEMDPESTEVFFNFDQPFEIHDDNEILYQLGLDEATGVLQPEFYQPHPQDVQASTENADGSNIVVVGSGSVMSAPHEADEKEQ